MSTIRNPQQGVKVRTNKKILSSYSYSFSGQELLDFFKAQGNDENTAKQNIQTLLTNGKILRLTGTGEFNSSSLYRHSNKKVVIIGGGVAGTAAAKTLQKNPYYEITIIDSRDYLEMAPMIPFLGSYYKDIASIRVPYSKFLKKCTIVQSKVKSVQPHEIECENGTKIQDYDYLILSTGSSYLSLPQKIVNTSVKPSTIVNVRETENFLKSLSSLATAKNVAIIGAGPSGVEIAGEFACQYPNLNISLIGSQKTLADKVYSTLPKNVTLILDRANEVVDDQVQLASGKTVQAELVYCCAGFIPNTKFLQGSHIPLTPKGYIQVDKKTLQVSGHPNVFAMGDIADIDAVKMNMFAAEHANIVSANIDKYEQQQKLSEYSGSNGRDVVQMVTVGVNSAHALKNNNVQVSGWLLRSIKVRMMPMLLSIVTK